MPYIITTTTERATARTANGSDLERHERSGTRDVTRRAVATLDEAHDYIGTMTDDDAVWNDARHVIESGGTIGPLPDGTVIEVRHVDWIAMRTLAGRLPVRTHDKPEVIDAYNAAA